MEPFLPLDFVVKPVLIVAFVGYEFFVHGRKFVAWAHNPPERITTIRLCLVSFDGEAYWLVIY